jgi:pyrroloquinoline quinone biosynthesis protein E
LSSWEICAGSPHRSACSDHIAGYRGAFQRKLALATEAVRLGLPLTINAVVHRANIARIREMVDLAIKLKAKRVEIAHVQYYG